MLCSLWFAMCTGALVQTWLNLGVRSVFAVVDLAELLISCACRFVSRLLLSTYSAVFVLLFSVTISSSINRYL